MVFPVGVVVAPGNGWALAILLVLAKGMVSVLVLDPNLGWDSESPIVLGKVALELALAVVEGITARKKGKCIKMVVVDLRVA